METGRTNGNQKLRPLFDELIEKLAEQEFKNRGFSNWCDDSEYEEYEKILDGLYDKFSELESEVIKIKNGSK